MKTKLGTIPKRSEFKYTVASHMGNGRMLALVPVWSSNYWRWDTKHQFWFQTMDEAVAALAEARRQRTADDIDKPVCASARILGREEFGQFLVEAVIQR